MAPAVLPPQERQRATAKLRADIPKHERISSSFVMKPQMQFGCHGATFLSWARNSPIIMILVANRGRYGPKANPRYIRNLIKNILIMIEQLTPVSSSWTTYFACETSDKKTKNTCVWFTLTRSLCLCSHSCSHRTVCRSSSSYEPEDFMDSHHRYTYYIALIKNDLLLSPYSNPTILRP